MNLEIERFADAGSTTEERVVFKVLTDGDIGSCAAFRTIKRTDGKISIKIQSPYWFPDRSVKKGDYLILYTKAGVNTQRKNTDDTSSHFFYWGLSDPIWKKPEDSIVLFSIGEWSFKSLG